MKAKLFFSVVTLLALIMIVFLWKEIKRAENITTQAAGQPLLANNTVPIDVGSGDAVIGNPGSTPEIIVFADLGDKKTRSLVQTIIDFVKNHPRDIHFIFKHFPSSHFFTPDAVFAHKGAYCAGKQNKFWEYVSEIANDNFSYSESGARKAASNLKLNFDTWLACTNSNEASSIVANDISEAQAFNMGASPLLFLNNKKVNTDQNFDLTDLLTQITTP